MLKSCVVLDGKVINIGEWDYGYETVEISPAIIDEETGEVISEAVTEIIANNPLPDGAYVDTRDFEYVDGWYEVGNAPISSEQVLLDRIEQLEREQALLLLQLVESGAV